MIKNNKRLLPQIADTRSAENTEKKSAKSHTVLVEYLRATCAKPAKSRTRVTIVSGLQLPNS